MSQKYHVNNNGDARPCSATQGGCPFGGEENHYSTVEEARSGYERQMEEETVNDAKALASYNEYVAEKDEMDAFFASFVDRPEIIATSDPVFNESIADKSNNDVVVSQEVMIDGEPTTVYSAYKIDRYGDEVDVHRATYVSEEDLINNHPTKRPEKLLSGNYSYDFAYEIADSNASQGLDQDIAINFDDTYNPITDIHSSQMSSLLSKAPVYSKTARVTMIKASPGEKLVTTLKNGTVETERTLEGGEHIVRNPDGEEYAMDETKFKGRYAPGENGEWVATGKVKAVVNPTGKPITIIAPWGEEQHGDENCLIAQSMDNENDRYIIGRDEFNTTYGGVK